MDRDEEELAIRVVMKFCPDTVEVSILFMMREPRNFISIAVHSGFTTPKGCSAWTVKKRDIIQNQWFMVRSMHKPRSDAGAATLRATFM